MRSTSYSTGFSRRSLRLRSGYLGTRMRRNLHLPTVLITTMAIPGQRFELDLNADNWTFDSTAHGEPDPPSLPLVIKEIQEHDIADVPPPPKIKQTKSGFPEHQARQNVSAFKEKQRDTQESTTLQQRPTVAQPSDAAIRNRVANKYGYDPTSEEKAGISKENERRIAAMSEEDIEEARAQLMQTLSPGLVERLLKRANIDDDPGLASRPQPPSKAFDGISHAKPDQDDGETADAVLPDEVEGLDDDNLTTSQPFDLPPSSVHFPVPSRDPSSYQPLDPTSATFLTDLRDIYFPSLTHTPTTLDWLNSSTPSTEPTSHSYSPNLASYPASSLRFNFFGSLIPPSTALSIPVTAGLHHHGNAPESAGYTIPELTLLARSTLPSQRCIAYQTIGRILYRLGKGDFGQPGDELNQALWSEIEGERVVEVIMTEANTQGGHVSARAYATEALWLWRKGGGGERGLRKPTEMKAK